MGGEEGGSASELHSISSVPPLPTLSPQCEGGEIEGADESSVGVEEHSSRQFLTCLLPQHTHTSPCPVGVQVSGAALKGPQALLSGKLTAVGKGDTQSHKNTCTYKCTRPTYTD